MLRVYYTSLHILLTSILKQLWVSCNQQEGDEVQQKLENIVYGFLFIVGIARSKHVSEMYSVYDHSQDLPCHGINDNLNMTIKLLLYVF